MYYVYGPAAGAIINQSPEVHVLKELNTNMHSAVIQYLLLETNKLNPTG